MNFTTTKNDFDDVDDNYTEFKITMSRNHLKQNYTHMC